jgi:hypothetical protein
MPYYVHQAETPHPPSLMTSSFILPAVWYNAVANADYSNMSDREFDAYIDWANRATEGLEFSHVTQGMADLESITFYFTEA